MRTTQTGSRGIRPAQSLNHDAQALPCEWEYLVPAVTTQDDGRATGVDVHSWMSHQKQLDDRQRPSATIGNSHRQRPCHSPSNDRLRASSSLVLVDASSSGVQARNCSRKPLKRCKSTAILTRDAWPVRVAWLRTALRTVSGIALRIRVKVGGASARLKSKSKS